MHQLDLSGEWVLRWSDYQRGRPQFAELPSPDPARAIKAQVPGEVHLDLWRAGLIADPYTGLGVLQARWVEENLWSYRREFDAPPEAASQRAWLVFERLDLVARIVLNGVEVGRHSNFFYPCRIDVTGKLRPGRNVLVVHLDAGLYDVADRPGEGYHLNPLTHPQARLDKRMWLRKPQCQFGWDWSQRLINVGISGPVRLEWSDAPARVDQLVPLVEVSPDLSAGTVRVRLFVEGLGLAPATARLHARLPQAGIAGEAEVQLRPGLHACELTLNVPHPRLWWPVGHGEQPLYDLEASLSIGGEVVGQRRCRIGFRRVRIDQDPCPAGGQYFIIEVNNRPIFAKGGNYVPADMIFAAVDQARERRLVDMALEANFNMLRVWGGGMYESDTFYDLCDERGILVWQEFIFACSRYPVDDGAFTENVRAEARYNIRRLAGRPSLVVWCGNNEMEWGAWEWGFDKHTRVLPDYAMFHLILPRLMSEEDPTRYYQPSSPFSPGGLHPNRDDVGDQHPWSVGFGDTDFRKYRDMACRFPNEGGILGPTSLPTMLACLPEGQRHIESFAWQVHDNSVSSWSESPIFPDEMSRQWLGRDIRQMSVEEYTFRGGLLQGEGLREYCENFRRRMFDTSSAIFWMYNDCWPAVRSWTLVDYYLRRTPAFWAVRRALAPLHVVLATQGDEVAVYGVNDTPQPTDATVRYGVINLAGGLPIDRQQQVALPANSSTLLAKFPKSQWPQPTRQMAFAMLVRDGRTIAQTKLFLPLLKEMVWPRADVRVSVRDGLATFVCDTFAWGVCLDLDGELPLADNFFDLLPGVPYTMPWPHAQKPQVLQVGNL